MENTLNIYSFNCRGLGNKIKRASVFEWLKHLKGDIYLLQETHSSLETENSWRQQWNGNLIFSHGETNSRGVAILTAKNLEFKIHSQILDNNGRFVLLDCSVNDINYIFVNLYAPTVDKPSDQAVFGAFICDTLKSYLGHNIVIGGDFNKNIEFLQNFGSISHDHSYVKYLHKLFDMLDLVDVWKLRNPDSIRYTRREKTRYGLVQSRIDYFLISSSLEYTTKSANILPGLKSDHSLLHICLLLEDQPTRGKGLWKMNTNLLKNEDFINLMKATIREATSDAQNLADQEMAWDYVKCRIRTESISFSIKNARKTRERIISLNKRLKILEEEVSVMPAPLLLEEVANIEKEIEDFYEQKAKGALIRSRCNFIENHERPSKFFLNLEKAKQKKCQIKALNIHGKRISNPAEILKAQKDFYYKLFSVDNLEHQKSVSDCMNYINAYSIPCISKTSKEICDADITMQEIEDAVKGLANNKAPGPDGLPGEFYQVFWTDISDLVTKTFHNAFDRGQLCESQRQGVICLIPKQGKDLTRLESWRPLSILNTDYKIITKVLGKRIKVALAEIINPDQIGYMQSRFCGENIRLISDIIDYCTSQKNPCLILLADFEKAFDKISWNFLHCCLKKFGFGSSFQKWISILYHNIESCVSNNGYQSEYFKISRDIRQGCPLSALLFLLPAEIIAIIIRSLDTIKGICVSNTCIKLCQLADDMTLFVRDNESIWQALQSFEEFYKYAGLKLNKSKTEAIIVQNDGSLYEDTNLGITWIRDSFKTLGTYFTLNYRESAILNINQKVQIIKDILNAWEARSLSLKGKITVVKALVIPHIHLLASTLSIDSKTIMELDTLLFRFIWNGGKPLISKNTLIQPLNRGGLKMVSVSEVIKTAQIMWIKRLGNPINAKWKVLSFFLMGITKKHLFSKLNFTSLATLPSNKFYSDVMSNWFDFINVKPRCLDELLAEPLFLNDLFQIGGQYISSEYSDWVQAGISTVADILQKSGTFRTKPELENMFNFTISHLKYNKIVSSVKKVSSSINTTTCVTVSHVQTLCRKTLNKINSQQIYCQFINDLYQTPASQNKWVEYCPFLDTIQWKQFYLLPSKIIRDTYLLSLQYKIIHRVFNCRHKLFLWKIIDSPNCLECEKIDNLEHFFYYCESSKRFWICLENWLSTIFLTL